MHLDCSARRNLVYNIDMKTIETKCEWCNGVFQVRPSYLKRGRGKFCSHSCCVSKTHAKKRATFKDNCKCAMCGKAFRKTPSRLKNSKSNLHFCSRLCKDKAQRIEGLEAMRPHTYKDGYSRYRQVAFRHHPHECKKCEYHKIVNVLVVHHIDRDHSNNQPENLEILCPTCHEEEHFLSKDGRFTNTSI